MNVKSISLAGLCLFLCLDSAVESHAAEVKVFLMGGQSNMLGRAPVSGLPLSLQGSQSDVLFFGGSDGTVGTTLETLRPDGKNPNEFGPEVTFGRSIADASPTTQYALIKYAAGGTALYNDWAPGTGAQYTAFRNTVTAGLAAIQAAGHTTVIVGMAWHQGENDAIEGQQANYASNLTAFIADIRANYGAGLPFLIGEIRRSNGPAFVTVADAQIAVAAADPNAVFVPASDLSFQDTYHFDAPSQITLGERFETAYASLSGGSEDTTLPTLNPSSIVDNKGGGTISPGTTVTYTITFSEDIDGTTVDSTDFDNAGSAAITIDAIVEISPGVFTVVVTANTMGTLQFRVPVSASIADLAGNLLDSDPAIADDTTLTVAAAPAPVIVPVAVFAPNQLSTARAAINMINSSQFDNGTLTAGTVSDNGVWTSNFLDSPLNDSTSANVAGSSPISPYTLTFDLGANYDLTSVLFWNWNNTVNRSAGVKTMEILVAPTVGGATTSLGVVNPAMGPGVSTYAGDTFLVSASDVREVKFVITEGYGFGTAGASTLIGIAEVRFRGTEVADNTFAAYISNLAFGLDSEDQGFNDDPDGDGIANGLEAWFGTHPGEFTPGLVGITTNGTTSSFTHPQNETPPIDVTGFYQWSRNLTDWYAGDGVDGPPLGPTVTITGSTNNGSTTVTSISSEVFGQVFFRASAVEN